MAREWAGWCGWSGKVKIWASGVVGVYHTEETAVHPSHLGSVQ